jgi:hypothetical protein
MPPELTLAMLFATEIEDMHIKNLVLTRMLKLSVWNNAENAYEDNENIITDYLVRLIKEEGLEKILDGILEEMEHD